MEQDKKWYSPIIDKLPLHNQKVKCQLKDFSYQDVTYKVQKEEWILANVQCWQKIY